MGLENLHSPVGGPKTQRGVQQQHQGHCVTYLEPSQELRPGAAGRRFHQQGAGTFGFTAHGLARADAVGRALPVPPAPWSCAEAQEGAGGHKRDKKPMGTSHRPAPRSSPVREPLTANARPPSQPHPVPDGFREGRRAGAEGWRCLLSAWLGVWPLGAQGSGDPMSGMPPAPCRLGAWKQASG